MAAGATTLLVDLIYELLDAHRDTVCLAEAVAGDPVWSAHLDYLCRLQRVGRELLAQAATEAKQT
jgi:hypothetical protein